ncbi:site-specific DNA-methyltransferase [Metamycoplasma hyosynoviae]
MNDNWIFDKNKFVWFLNSKEFLPDSYTRFSNKIGLSTFSGGGGII